MPRRRRTCPPSHGGWRKSRRRPSSKCKMGFPDDAHGRECRSRRTSSSIMHGQPARGELVTWFDPARHDVRRRPGPGLVHEGPHRPARVVRSHSARLGRGDRRMRQPGRAPIRPFRPVSDEDAARDHSGHGRRDSETVLVDRLAVHGSGRRLLEYQLLPALPGRGNPRTLAQAKAISVFERMDEPASTAATS